MSAVEGLTDEQWQYICSKIPKNLARDFFNKHPKEFQRIERGFRAKSLTDRKVENILIRHRRDPYVEGFIVSFLELELNRFREKLDQQEGEQEAHEIYIDFLVKSIFSENTALFFQLIEKEAPKEYIQLMETAIRREKRYISQLMNAKNEKLREDREQEDIIQSLKDQLTSVVQEQQKLRESFYEMETRIDHYEKQLEQKDESIVAFSSDIEELKKEWKHYEIKDEKTDKRIEESFLYSNNLEEKISKLQAHALELEESMAVLNKDHVQAVENVRDLLESYREEEGKVQEESPLESALKWENVKPVRPVEMEIFEEFFEYNLKSMGLEDSKPTYDLFLEYIESIIFTGIPLLVKTFQGINLANCLANTLSGKSSAASIHYSYGMSLIEFKALLDDLTERVWCIHNVIGSTQELSLLTLLSHYRDKIIIITYPTERTLYFCPQEILNYAHYINFDNYHFMAQVQDLREDPSILDEDTYEEDVKRTVGKKQSTLIEIGKQCGLSEEVVRSMIVSMEDGDALDGTLLFTLLPYVSKVLERNPYVESKRLDQYAGVNGKSLQKKSMLEWFNE